MDGEKNRPQWTLAGFVRFCRYLRTEDGKPLVVYPFQRRFLRDIFALVIEVAIIMPKKNGKTTILAALALYHAICVNAAEAFIAAASKEQATKLWRQACMLLRRSGKKVGKDSWDIGGFVFTIQPGYRHISCGESFIRVIAGDPRTEDGAIPSLVLVDELHRHRDGELYGILRDGVDARDGQVISISTAGWDMDSSLGKIRKQAHALPTFKRTGPYNVASMEGFAFHEWCLEDGDDLNDLRLVKRANPAPWQTLAKLRLRKISLSMTPARWARFACCVWTHGEEPWLQAPVWNALRVDVGGLMPGDPAVASMVYGAVSAVVIAGMRSDESVAVKAWISEGEIGFDELEDLVTKVNEEYPLDTVCYDSSLTRSAQILAERGLPMTEFPLVPARLQTVTVTLRRLIDGKLLRHDGDERLRQHVLAGATKDSERGWRLIPTPETKGLIALAVAAHMATQISTGPVLVVPAGVA